MVCEPFPLMDVFASWLLDELTEDALTTDSESYSHFACANASHVSGSDLRLTPVHF